MNCKMDTTCYLGKKVFIGIDVHKRSYSLSAVCEDVIVKKWSMPAEIDSCVSVILSHFNGANIYTAYEAGFSGYSLHRKLISQGINSIVVCPSSIQKSPNDRVKTDLLDSKKLAIHLSKGMLRGIHVPSVEQERKREITRLRSQLVDHRITVSNQIKSKLMYFGEPGPEGKKRISKKFLGELLGRNLPFELMISLKALTKLWIQLTDQIYEVEKEIAGQEAENQETSKIYRSVPGIGLISSRVLANELGDLSRRFKNERELFSYTGLTPSEYSSGESIRKGRISRCGPPRIRWILTEAAWICIRHDKSLSEIYERIRKRRGAKRAIVAVARRLIGRIRACFVNQVLYAPQGA